MTLLTRYIVKNNIILLGLCCFLLGIIYAFFNFIENVDDMTEASASVITIIKYYILTAPKTITLLLVLLFFLVIVIQITLMIKNKEMLALLSAGISLQQIITIFMFYSVVWACFSFVLTELAIVSEKSALEIYRYEIRPRKRVPPTVQNVWFKNNTIIFNSKSIVLDSGKINGLILYTSSDNFNTLDAMYKAEEAQFIESGIQLLNVIHTQYDTLSLTTKAEFFIPFSINLKAMQVLNTPIPEVSFIEIVNTYFTFLNTGMNVSDLLLAIQVRITSSLAFIVMTALALLIAFSIEKIYVAIALSFVTAILFFLSKELIHTLARLNIINSILAPWLPLVFWLLLCIFIVYMKKRKH